MYQLNDRHEITVSREESDFDRACESAMKQALFMFGSDDRGHLTRVEGSDRCCDSVELEFIGLTFGASIAGRVFIYTFETWVERYDDENQEG